MTSAEEELKSETNEGLAEQERELLACGIPGGKA